MIRPYTTMAAQPITTCHRHTHSLKMSVCVALTLTAMQAPGHGHVSGNSVASLSLSAPLPPCTRAPHTVSPAVELTGEGELRLEQAAHIGSLSCPNTLSPTPRHPHQPHCQQPGWCHTYPTLAPDVTHATPCSLWRKTGGHLPFLDGGRCQGDIATALSAGRGLTLPLPYSVAQKEGGSGPAPTGWEPWPPPRLRKEGIGS